MKEGVVKYVKIIKRLFIAFSIVVLPALMVSLVFAFSKVFAFYFIAPALFLLWVVVYGLYAMYVSMGTVLGVEIAGGTVNLTTKRKTFSYDLDGGCVDIKVRKNSFVGTFRTESSQDKFIFHRRVFFSKYSQEQFTVDDVRRFYPSIDDIMSR